jgi:hypothetical protein
MSSVPDRFGAQDLGAYERQVEIKRRAYAGSNGL